MNLLQAVNYILPYLGEAPVTSLDIRHPTVAMVLDNIQTSRARLLARGWWFNELHTKLYPSSEGDISAPTQALAIYSDVNIEERNGKIYNITDGTYVFTTPIDVKIIEDLSFEELPTYAALCIQERAAIDTYVKDFGVEKVVELIQTREKEALWALEQENLRKRKYNSLKNNRAMRYISALRG
jgi:hypothetical protein